MFVLAFHCGCGVWFVARPDISTSHSEHLRTKREEKKETGKKYCTGRSERLPDS